MPQKLFRGECEVEAFHPEKVEQARSKLLSTGQARGVASSFQAMAHPARLQILRALHETELCVCDLAQVLDLSVATVSHHLKELRNAELVTYRTEGRMAYYSLGDDPFLRYYQDAVMPSEQSSEMTA